LAYAIPAPAAGCLDFGERAEHVEEALADSVITASVLTAYR